MIKIVVPPCEEFDDEKQIFIYSKECTLILEHSLISISKWESKWNKIFLSKREKTTEEVIDYIRCMTVNKNVPSNVYNRLTSDNIKKINEYIDAPMTATSFSDEPSSSSSREQVSSELIYYWMIMFNVPMDCQKWHLNRLLTLIKICNIKNQPKKKKSINEIMKRNSDLNAERRKKMKTKG